MHKSCEECKKSFITYQSRQKFCSISCSQKSRHSKKEVFCKNCNIKFETCFGTNSRIFCTVECFHKWNSKEKVPFVCENCSKTIYVLEKVIKNKKTCSKQCKYELLAKENSIKFSGIEGHSHNSYKNGNTYYKKYAMKNFNHICICCNVTDVMFDVHHIDGCRSNNSLNNLCIICRSCHKRLHTISVKYSISLEKSLSVTKIISHVPKSKNYLRLPGVVEQIQAAVNFVMID